MKTVSGNFAEVDKARKEVKVSCGGVGDVYVVLELDRIDGEVFVRPSFHRGGVPDNSMSLEEFKRALTQLQEALDVAHASFPGLLRKQEVLG